MSSLRSVTLKPVTASAPGRLDFLGGVADYSGSLVLEMPTQIRTSVTLTPEKTGQARFASAHFGAVEIGLAPLGDLVCRDATPSEFRAHLDALKFPRWARYPLGCFIILSLHTRFFPDTGFFLQVGTAVPDGQGVSSSAALEIATLRALNDSAGLNLPDIELARFGQRAENLIVGASCGLMDQLASSCGHPGQLLPILCRPDQLSEPLVLPESLAIVGWPSGVKHSVGASPYATARAASFMGKRNIEDLSGKKWKYTSEISPEVFREFESVLPEVSTGADFLAAYDGTDDPLTTIDPRQSYPVRAATRFPIEENSRAHRARRVLSRYERDPEISAREMRNILKASHDGYSAMGLGSPETDKLVEYLLKEPVETGFIGGRISGGGSGGTVVVLLEKRSIEKLKSLAAEHSRTAIIY